MFYLELNRSHVEKLKIFCIEMWICGLLCIMTKIDQNTKVFYSQ